MDRPSRQPLFLFAAVVLAAGMGALAWWWWPKPSTEPDPLAASSLDQRLLGVEQTLSSLKRGQSRNEQRLADLEARSKVLRDEVLGLGQRAALVEETVQQVSAGSGSAPGTRLRLDEVDLLLSFAEARLTLSGDVAGARRAYEIADGLLSALTAPQFVNLRQSLAQEQAALAALPVDPRMAVESGIQSFEAALVALETVPAPATDVAPTTPLNRLVDALVDVRPRGVDELLAPADRQRGDAALRLELGLARLASDRRDQEGLNAALARAAVWAKRLYAPSGELEKAVTELQALAQPPLVADAPVLGSTLAQLRAQRRAEGAP